MERVKRQKLNREMKTTSSGISTGFCRKQSYALSRPTWRTSSSHQESEPTLADAIPTPFRQSNATAGRRQVSTLAKSFLRSVEPSQVTWRPR